MEKVAAVIWLLAFSPQDAGPYVLVVGIVLVSAALLMGIRKKRLKSKHRPSGREQLERSRQHNAMRGDLEQTMVELEQLAKRLSSQLDAKTLTIEKRLAEADQRIAELQRLDQSSRANIDTPASEPSTATRDGPPITAEPPASPQPVNQSTPAATGPAPAEQTDETTRTIYRLADEGLEPAQIAQQVDEHVGKVELILALRHT